MTRITSRIRKFKKDLKDNGITDGKIVKKYVLFGTPYIFEKNEEAYFNLKEEIADHFSISITNVVMTGSARLGFSIKPGKLWTHISSDSDIDIAIIHEGTFDRYWKDLFEFNVNITPRSTEEDTQFRKFLEYLFKGWIRPDLFPFNYQGKKEWFEFTRKLYNKYDNRKLSIGIFRNEYFFENYQISNIKTIRGGL